LSVRLIEEMATSHSLVTDATVLRAMSKRQRL
jgi:hypothetical protein